MPFDIFISAAAISDWKIKKFSSEKIKKNQSDTLNITFSKNLDILKNISNHKFRPKLIIGFSAETSNLMKNSIQKFKSKNCDWMIANNVANGEVFGSSYNKVSLITNSTVEHWPKLKKSEIAKKITKKIVNYFKRK